MTQNYYQGRAAHPPMNHMANGPVIPPRSQFSQQQRPLQQQHHQQQSYQSAGYSSNATSYSQLGGSHSRNGSTGNNNSNNNLSQQQGYGGTTTTNNNNNNNSYSSYNSDNSSSVSTGSSSLRSKASMSTSNSTATMSSFQERMKERDRENRQRERQERDTAARAIREDPKLNTIATSQANAAAIANTNAQSTGATIWNKLRAAKDIINTTITGEERWPDSDESDHEGCESHVTRVLREYQEKKEADEIARKISELEMSPYNSNSNQTLHKSPSQASFSSTSSSGRNPYLRDGGRKDYQGSPTSPTAAGGQDFYGRPFRARGDSNANSNNDHQPSRSEDISSRRMRSRGESDASNGSSGHSGFNRYRTASDASRDEALSRLEGKRTADVLNAQISHLGSTRVRAHSPHGGRRQAPEPPSVPSPVLPSNSLGAYGQRVQQQQQYGSNKSFF